MKLEVKFKKTGVLMGLKFQLVTGEIVSICCHNISSQKGLYIAYDAVFEKAGYVYSENESIRLIRMISKVIEARVFASDVVTTPKWEDANLESITFSTGDELKKRYSLPSYVMKKFQKITVAVDGFEETMSVEKYNKIAEFVRQKDYLENLENALGNQLNESYYANILLYMHKEMVLFPATVAEEWSAVEDYSGEDELRTLESIVDSRGGMAWYTLISNKGTNNECDNLVLLMCSNAETWMGLINIRERDNGADMPLKEGDVILTDDNGEMVDLFFVDEIIFQGKECFC